MKEIKLNEYKSNPISVLKKSSEIIQKFSKLLGGTKPNLLIVLGDKYETLILTYCAFIFRIPIAHIHGGEKTVGSLDDTFRHQISKMSSVHFVEREVYKKRLIQLGESPSSVFTVGGMGVDNINNTKIISKKILESKLKIKFFKSPKSARVLVIMDILFIFKNYINLICNGSNYLDC